VHDAPRVAPYRRLMVGRGGKLVGGYSRLGVAKFGNASFSGVLPFLGLLALVMVANSGFSDLKDGRSYVTGPLTREVLMRGPRSDVASGRVVPSNGGRVFAWPTHGTSTYQRAARMARHGDPEAQRFVGRESDVNPFDVP
jgi:hypothetical protein